MTLTVTSPPLAVEAAPRTPTRPVRPPERAPDVTSRPDIVDVWGQDSFPASDAPANW